jgi:hypothetical protein
VAVGNSRLAVDRSCTSSLEEASTHLRGKSHVTHVTQARDLDLRAFLRSWTWKREHLPDRDRFIKPYKHELRVVRDKQARWEVLEEAHACSTQGLVSSSPANLKRAPGVVGVEHHRSAVHGNCVSGACPASAVEVQLSLRQARFAAGGAAGGFASTVWDSAIVVARLLEARPVLVAGRRCLDLSAGCGLVGGQGRCAAGIGMGAWSCWSCCGDGMRALAPR